MVLVEKGVKEGDAPYPGEVVEGAVGGEEGAVEVAGEGEVAEGLGEGDGADSVPGVYLTSSLLSIWQTKVREGEGRGGSIGREVGTNSRKSIPPGQKAFRTHLHPQKQIACLARPEIAGLSCQSEAPRRGRQSASRTWQWAVSQLCVGARHWRKRGCA